MAEELEVLAEGVDLPHEGKPDVPPASNIVWDFALGIQHSICPSSEQCTLLAKTIRCSGKDKYLKLKSYHPSVFASIREASGIKEQVFLEEWDPDSIAHNTPNTGAGKSGALFVVSRSRRFLLKTLRREEKDTLRVMAPGLLRHFLNNPGSLLSRQYALCRIKVQGAKRYFVVFNNLFCDPSRTPSFKYDLKGARINRKSKASDLTKPGHVRMDLDFPRQFPIEPKLREIVLQQINQDADFLASHNVMDYSLLVGVSNEIQSAEPPKRKKKHKKRKKDQQGDEEETVETEEVRQPEADEVWKLGLTSRLNEDDTEGQREHFMIGIIDILQDYNTFKKSAHAIKVLRFCTSSGLSTVDSEYYADRFKAYMENSVLS